MKLTLRIHPEKLAICRLGPGAIIPDWALNAHFRSITWTDEEISIICGESHVPENIDSEDGWRALMVQGPLNFSDTGILASLAGPLSDAGISIFALSTFVTDYILVKDAEVDHAVQVLTDYGHTFV